MESTSEREPVTVPYIVHEGALARMERQIKRLFIILIVLICGLVVSNAAWIYAWCQYDYSAETIAQDGEGINIIGGRDINYGPDYPETPED